MDMQFDIPTEVSYVTETLQKGGFEAYLVGGCVRDLIMGRKPKDWDVTTNAKPDQIQALFPHTFYENDYGTVGVVSEETTDETLKIIEVTPYRSEGEYSNKRHPDSVSFGDNLEEDLERRDFTINAIALDIFKGHFIDPYKGQEDIKDKTIRAVGSPVERFNEDALRILRAVRLASELEFAIEPVSYETIKKTAKNLAEISKERIRDEFTRIIMSPRPMFGILLMHDLGLLNYVLPELEKGIGVDQNQAHAYTVFEHVVRSLQAAADKNFPLEVRLAALLHDVAKPHTRQKDSKKNDWSFHGHEVVGAAVAKKSLVELRFPKSVIDKVYKLVRWHMFFSDTEQITLSAVRRIIAKVGEENIWDLMDIRVCDRIGTGRPKEQPYRLRKYHSMIEEAMRNPISPKVLKIDGARIMEVTHETPGPKIGFVLHALLEEAIDDPSKNTAEYMEKRALELIQLPEKELRKLGEKGKERKEEEDQKEVKKIRGKHFVE